MTTQTAVQPRRRADSGLNTMDRGQILTGERNHYQLKSKIDSGGIGHVWKAETLSTGQIVAVKLLHSERFELTDAVRARFAREYQHGSRICHPNLVSVIDACHLAAPVDGIWFLVMNWVKGLPLSSVIESLDPSERHLVALEMIAGLEHLHSLGFVHRDLKPSNVILHEEGMATICDYGLVRHPDDLCVTRVGDKVGAALYMSPHQFRNPSAAIEQDDIYSLCAVLYELFSGERMSIQWSTESMIHCSQKTRDLIEATLTEKYPRRPQTSLETLRRTLSTGVQNRL